MGFSSKTCFYKNFETWVEKIIGLGLFKEMPLGYHDIHLGFFLFDRRQEGLTERSVLVENYLVSGVSNPFYLLTFSQNHIFSFSSYCTSFILSVFFSLSWLGRLQELLWTRGNGSLF